MKIKLLSLAATTCIVFSICTNADTSQKVLWTAVFSNTVPVNSSVSQAYCDSHTPTVMVTTIDQITSKQGVIALNGINVRYLSYKTIEKDNIYFNVVNATISGKDASGAWSMPMKLYEQTLSPIGTTYTVWSTSKCKGTFLGTPTVLQSTTAS